LPGRWVGSSTRSAKEEAKGRAFVSTSDEL